MTSPALRSADKQPAAVHLVVQVWGEFYTRAFIEFGLPALLSPRNLGALAARLPCRFYVFTTAADEAVIRGSRAYQVLTRTCEVTFVAVDLEQRDKYAVMTACNMAALRNAERADAAVVFLVPDTIWSDGSLATVADACSRGFRAVMQAGVRVVAETALPVLRQRFRGMEEGVIVADARELVRLALDHMHPYYRGWYWDAERFNRNPANCYWRVGEDGLVARCFHLHPLMLYPERSVSGFTSTLDDDLPILALTSVESAYVVEDSDQVFHLDLADASWGSDYHELPGGPTPAYLARWASECANAFHRAFMEFPIRFHAGELSGTWDPVVGESARVVRLMRRCAVPETIHTRLLEHLFGIDRRVLIDRARHGLGWHLLPELPWWWRWLPVQLQTRRIGPIRRRALVRTLMAIFGVNVTTRAFGGDVGTAKAHRKIRTGSLRDAVRQAWIMAARNDEERRAAKFRYTWAELLPRADLIFASLALWFQRRRGGAAESRWPTAQLPPLRKLILDSLALWVQGRRDRIAAWMSWQITTAPSRVERRVRQLRKVVRIGHKAVLRSVKRTRGRTAKGWKNAALWSRRRTRLAARHLRSRLVFGMLRAVRRPQLETLRALQKIRRRAPRLLHRAGKTGRRTYRRARRALITR